ncbi:MAG: hypothetical protein IPI49_31040 [Myxococcales bacterium]|nr:hypothetical protein [Myxococcales bacterium]
MSTPLDLDLYLPAIAAGEVEAFAAFLVGAEAPLRRALGSFASTVDVEAVVQETFLRVWQVAPRLVPDGKPQALLRFCHRCARNLCISETRRRSRADLQAAALLAQLEEDELASLAPEAAPDPLLRVALAHCRDRLPKKPQAALESRLEATGDVPDATLAERLGMTLNTFLQNFTRARRLLAECLRKAGVDHPLLGDAP